MKASKEIKILEIYLAWLIIVNNKWLAVLLQKRNSKKLNWWLHAFCKAI